MTTIVGHANGVRRAAVDAITFFLLAAEEEWRAYAPFDDFEAVSNVFVTNRDLAHCAALTFEAATPKHPGRSSSIRFSNRSLQT